MQQCKRFVAPSKGQSILPAARISCSLRTRRRSVVQTRAYVDAERFSAVSGSDQIPSAVSMFPTILNATALDQLPQASSDRITYHTSFWYDALVKEHPDLPHKIPVGMADYERALRVWTDAYQRSEPRLHQAVANKDGDVFVISLSKVKNTGTFLGIPPTGHSSLVLGIHRFALDADMKVNDVWSFRSGTAEERKILVKDPTTRGDISSWATGLTLYPASWAMDQSVAEGARNTVRRWMYEVWGQAPNLKALDEILAPDVQLYDGMSIKTTRPHVGASTFKEAVQKLHGAYQFGGLIDLAVAISPASNLAFIHWTHCLTQRETGKMSHVDGITLLVLDHASKIIQVLDFSTMLEEQKPVLLLDRHPALRM